LFLYAKYTTLNTATIMDAMVDTGFLCNKATILRDMTFYHTAGVKEEYETQHTFINMAAKL
jgi:hypothetical protein